MPALHERLMRILPPSLAATLQTPSRDLPQSPTLIARQNNPTPTFVAIPTTYNNLDDSLSPGIIVAIVLGSVAAVLLVLFLIYSALGFGPVVFTTTTTRTREISSSSVLSFHTRRGSKRRRPGHAHVHATEMFEVRTREGPGRGVPVVVTTAGPRPPPPRSAPPPPRVVREDDVDEVVVIEEHSPSRRQSRRHSTRSRRSDERREGRREERRRSRSRYS